MERFFNKLIGYMRAIKVAGVDVGDTEANNLAQDRDCTVVVRWRTEHMRPSQLHGAVPRASKDQIIGELECASWQCCRRRILSFGFHVRVCTVSPGAGAATARSSAILPNPTIQRRRPLSRQEFSFEDECIGISQHCYLSAWLLT